MSRVGGEGIEPPMTMSPDLQSGAPHGANRPLGGEVVLPATSRRKFSCQSAMPRRTVELRWAGENRTRSYGFGDRLDTMSSSHCVLFGRARRRAQASAWLLDRSTGCSPYDLCPNSGWRWGLPAKACPRLIRRDALVALGIGSQGARVCRRAVKDEHALDPGFGGGHQHHVVTMHRFWDRVNVFVGEITPSEHLG